MCDRQIVITKSRSAADTVKFGICFSTVVPYISEDIWIVSDESSFYADNEKHALIYRFFSSAFYMPNKVKTH